MESRRTRPSYGNSKRKEKRMRRVGEAKKRLAIASAARVDIETAGRDAEDIVVSINPTSEKERADKENDAIEAGFEENRSRIIVVSVHRRDSSNFELRNYKKPSYIRKRDR